MSDDRENITKTNCGSIVEDEMNVCIQTFLGQTFHFRVRPATSVLELKVLSELRCCIPSDLHILKHKDIELAENDRTMNQMEVAGTVVLELHVAPWWNKFINACMKGEINQVAARIRIKMSQTTHDERAFVAAFIAAGKGDHDLLRKVLKSDFWCVDIERKVVFSGRTLLHSAVAGGDISCVVNIIITSNGNVLLNHFDENHEKPLDLARRLEQPGLVQLLTKYQELKIADKDIKRENVLAIDTTGRDIQMPSDPLPLEINSSLKSLNLNHMCEGEAFPNEEVKVAVKSNLLGTEKAKKIFQLEKDICKRPDWNGKYKNTDTKCCGSAEGCFEEWVKNTTERDGKNIIMVNEKENSTEQSRDCISNVNEGQAMSDALIQNEQNIQRGASSRGKLKLRIPPRTCGLANSFVSQSDKECSKSVHEDDAPFETVTHPDEITVTAAGCTIDAAVPAISIEHEVDLTRDQHVTHKQMCKHVNNKTQLSPCSECLISSQKHDSPVPHPPHSPPTDRCRSRSYEPQAPGSQPIGNVRSRSPSPSRVSIAMPPGSRRPHTPTLPPNVTSRSRSPQRAFGCSPSSCRRPHPPTSPLADNCRSRSPSPNRETVSSPQRTPRPHPPTSPLAERYRSLSPSSDRVLGESPPRYRRTHPVSDSPSADGGRSRSPSPQSRTQERYKTPYSVKERPRSAILKFRTESNRPSVETDLPLPKIAKERPQSCLSVDPFNELRRGSMPIQSLSAPNSPQNTRKRLSLRENQGAYQRLIDLRLQSQLEESDERRKSFPWNVWKSVKRPDDQCTTPPEEIATKERRKSFDVWLTEKEEDNMKKLLLKIAAKRAEEKAMEEELWKLSRTGKTYEEWLEEKSRENHTKKNEVDGNVMENDVHQGKTKSHLALKYGEWLKRKDDEALKREEMIRKDAEKQFEEMKKKREEEAKRARVLKIMAP